MKSEIHEDPQFAGHFLFPMTANGRGYGKVYFLEKNRDEVIRIAEAVCDENEIFVQDEQTVLEISRFTAFSYKGKIKERDRWNSVVVWPYTDEDCQHMVDSVTGEFKNGEIIGFVVPRNWQDPTCYLWNPANSTSYAMK